MQHDEFIGLVQHRARLASRGEAERASRATLETLGERIPEGVAENVAGQLPQEIGEHLRRTEIYGGTAAGERFDRREFIARVGERAGVGDQQAVCLVRAVTGVLDDAVQKTLTDKITDSLPADIADLVTAGSAGDARGPGSAGA